MSEKEGKEELSPEEKAKLMEGRREYALKNLKATHLQDLAGAFYVDSSDGQFGKDPNNVMWEYKYSKALGNTKAYDPESGEEFDILRSNLLKSRKGNKLYSESVSSYDIIKTSAAILQNALESIKVDDLAELGLISNGELLKKFSGKYISELDKESKEAIIGSYQTWLAKTKLIEAEAESVKDVKKGLESILLEPPQESPKK